MNAYITGENGERVSGQIEFMDPDGGLIVIQHLSVNGTVLNPDYLNAAANVVVSAPGYYEFGTPVHTLLEENEFQLVKKPSPVKYIIIGAALFLVLSELRK